MMKTAGALLLLAGLVNNAAAKSGTPIVPAVIALKTGDALRVEVRGSRVKATDLFGASVADIDLGPTPPIGSSRMISRTEIERAFASANAAAPKKIPSSVRVSRKTRRLGAPEVGSAIRAALATKPLPRGATLSGVRAQATEVGDDYHHVTVDLPVLPRRAGPTTAQATVTFMSEGDVALHKTIVGIELSLPPEAAFPEIARGAPIALVIRRGLVEVSISGVAATDADIGAILPVTIKPSGRVLRARAIDKDHAVVVDES